MANNLKHPFEDKPSSSSSAGEKEVELVSSEKEGHHQHTIFSSEDDEPENPPPRIDQLSGRKRLSEGISSSKRTKKIEKTGAKRLFNEKDEIVLLQGIIDYKGRNPFEDKRSFYESMKGSFSFDVTLDQFNDKIRTLKRKYTNKVMRGGEATCSNPNQEKCFQLSKVIWGAQGIAFESASGKSKESERRVSKKRDLVTAPKGKNVSKRRGDMEKSAALVEKKSDWDESCFFVGMDFLKEKWAKVPTETKKETQEKMKKLHANELECQKYEEMLKVMKDKCAQEKVELLNEITSLIMATD